MFTTIRFQVHNLSKHKESLLIKAIKQNDMAYFKAIDNARPIAELLVATTNKKERSNLIAHLKNQTTELLRPLPFSTAIKNGVVETVAAQVSSYAELMIAGEAPSYQKKFDTDLDYVKALDDLAHSTTLDSERKAIKEINRIQRYKHRPINYVRHRIGDGFMLLSDGNGRIFAFLSLWDSHDKRSEMITIDMLNVQRKQHKEGGRWFQERITKCTRLGMLVPLEYGHYQQELLKVATPRQAELLYRDNGIFLHVAVEHTPTRIETDALMGLDRGILTIAAYAIRHPSSGVMMEKGFFDGLTLREYQRHAEKKQQRLQQQGSQDIRSYKNVGKNELHLITNAIVQAAVTHKAWVCVEDLKAITNGHHHKRPRYASRSNFNRLLSRQQYAKLLTMLSYKLIRAGLPPPRFIRAAYTSQLCPACSHKSPQNRGLNEERVIFCCEKCSFTEHADIVGAINIAGKAIWLEKNGKQFKALKQHNIKIPPELYFDNWQRDNLKR